MPIIASAKKRMRQNSKRNEQNHPFLAHMRSMVKNVVEYAKKNDAEKIGRAYSDAQSALDKCVKKNLIHKNNAAHKKSLIAKAVAGIKDVKITKKTVVKKAKKTAPKK